MEQWSSGLGFVLAAVGAAVGLGNIWRFPAVVGANGGGAYLIPYFVAAAAFALPLMILEISVGRSFQSDIITACRRVRGEYEIVGWLIAGSVLVVLSYYLVITGWVLAFFTFSVTGAETSFGAFTDSYQPVAFYLISTLLVGAVVSIGVQDGIERMSKLLIPGMFLILFGLLAFTAVRDGFGDGLEFLFTPETAVLSDPAVWSAAFGQVFFSFSVGQGIMLTYGSYLDESTGIPRAATIIATVDLVVALLAGVIIFGIVFSTPGLEPASGTELAFTVLPIGFADMPLGEVLAAAFFGLLFFAALSSSVSMLEVGVAGLKRSTGWSRRRASAVVTAVVALGGLPSALSYSAAEVSLFGRPFLDGLDATVGTLGLPLGALAIVGIFAWGQDRATVRAQVGETIALPLVKYAVPVVLGTITGLRLVAGIDLAGWRRLPGIAQLGGGEAAAVTLGVGAVLVLGAAGLRRLRRERGSRAGTG